MGHRYPRPAGHADRNSADMVVLRVLLVSVALAFCGWWYYRMLCFVTHDSWRLLRIAASFASVLVYRCVCGGPKDVAGELSAVRDDLVAPFRVAVSADSLTGRQLYEKLLIALCTSTSYLYAYGIFASVLIECLVTPVRVLGLFGSNLWNGLLSLGSIPVMLVAAMFFHFVFQTLISVLYHRYFSHRAFVASRVTSFGLGVLVTAARQRGPLWWASIHGRHHRECDKLQNDPHSPIVDGFLYAHLGWLIDRNNFRIQAQHVQHWLKECPELLLVDLFFMDLGGFHDGMWKQLIDLCSPEISYAVFVGFFIGRVTSWHVTFCVNSVCHGDSENPKSQPTCKARDIWYLGILSCGETSGHERHHTYPREARNARPEDFDVGMLSIRAAEHCGIIWNVQAANMKLKKAG